MIEVEVKLPIDSACRIERTLETMGFKYQETITQEDRYYDNAAGMIRGSGQALRLRCNVWGQTPDVDVNGRGQTPHSDCCITFKGHKLDTVSMTREELETTVGDRNDMHGILTALGFSVAPPVVKKIRKEYEANLYGQNNKEYVIHACLDQVEGLGPFLELEIMADECDREDALCCIEELLHSLGYTLSDTTTNSYLSMLQGIED